MCLEGVVVGGCGGGGVHTFTTILVVPYEISIYCNLALIVVSTTDPNHHGRVRGSKGERKAKGGLGESRNRRRMKKVRGRGATR